MAPDNINLCYASPTPFRTIRVYLIVSAKHYQHETIQRMDALSVWKSADKRRRSEHMHESFPRPEVQELSWEIDSADIVHACTIMRAQQHIEVLDSRDYLQALKEDPQLELADHLMSDNGNYPTLGQEATA